MPAVQDNNALQDELLPEIEISIIPYKHSDNVRVDLFQLTTEFIEYLISRGIIDDDVHNDVQHMALPKAIGFCRIIRDNYKMFKAEKSTNADV